jgi:uncharacterized protein (DUF305 family)
MRLVAVLLLLASTFATAVTPAAAAPTAPNRDWQRYEKNVLKKLMNHHLYEIQVAQLCLTQATHPELIGLCQRLLDTLPQEIATFQGWLQSWYGVSYTARLTAAEKATIAHLARPKVQGAKFEIQSMKLYRLLFRLGVQMETTCAKRAPHTELANVCAQGLVTNSQDFRSVTQWLCNWHERCYGKTEPTAADVFSEDW